MMTVFLDLLTTFLAAVVGLLYFKKLTVTQRLIFFQVILYIIIDLSAVNIPEWNQALFSIHIPLETALLTTAVYYYYRSALAKRVLAISYSLFLCVYLFDVMFVPGFAHHGLIAEGLLMSVVFISVLYNEFVNENHQKDMAIKLMSLGMVLYFVCTIPYMCSIFYFHDLNPVIGRKLFRTIIVQLASLRYLLIAVAFFMTGFNGYQANKLQFNTDK